MNLISVLSQMRKGKLLNEANDKLAALVKQCRDTSKVGTFTLKIKVKPANHGEVWLTDDVDTKTPKPDATLSLFYDDKEGALLKDDPNQPELPNVVPVETSKAAALAK